MNIARDIFFTQHKKQGESFDDFVTQVKRHFTDFKFRELKESLIRDVIVIGVADDTLRKRMRRESDLSPDKAVKLGQSAEETTKHIQVLKVDPVINAIQRQAKPYNEKTEIKNARSWGKYAINITKRIICLRILIKASTKDTEGK